MNDKHDDCSCSGNSIVRSKGEYTIIVVRLTFNIKLALPYPLWGTLYLQNQSFASAVKDYLPAGVTCTSSVSGENIILTYVNGALTDTIVLLGLPESLLTYPEMLANLNQNYLKTELAYFCNNAQGSALITNQQNLLFQSKPLYLTKIGGLGDKKNEMILPVSRKLPNNSVGNVTEISLRKQDIMPDTVWIHSFAYIPITAPRIGLPALVFYWQIIINDIVNMNKSAFKLE